MLGSEGQGFGQVVVGGDKCAPGSGKKGQCLALGKY